MDTVRLVYDLDRETAVAASAAVNAGDPGLTAATAPLRRRNAAYALLAAGLFAGLYLAGVSAGLIALQGIALSGAVATVNLATWKRRQGYERVLRRVFNDPAASAALGRRTVEFTRKGLVVDTEYSREEYAWPAVLRVKHTPDFLLLTLPGPRPLAIPRSAFPTTAEFDRFADDLRAAVGVTV